jgi:alkaline phosphatase
MLQSMTRSLVYPHRPQKKHHWPFLALLVAGSAVVSFAHPPVPASPSPTDRIRALQRAADANGSASWGHWGDQPDRYVSWSNHSNRLIPIYLFGHGVSLRSFTAEGSVYRDPRRLEELYGRLPEATLNPDADYCDQTDIHRLQRRLAEEGRRFIILMVFDGLDWTMTRTAATALSGHAAYASGRGTGLSFLDQGFRSRAEGTPLTDWAFCVTSPANGGTRVDVDAQAVLNPGGTTPGGYDPLRGGGTPWDSRASARYLMGRDRERPHAVTDSAASATSLCSGVKTYNDAINVGPDGEPTEPIARTLQQAGYAVGVVTSVPVSHATPACAYANNVSRDDYQDLSRDLLGEPSIAHPLPLPGVDLLIGCGAGVDSLSDKGQGANFEPGSRYVADSTIAAIDRSRGGRYVLARRTPGRRGAEVLAEAVTVAGQNGRIFGLFGTADGHLPFRTADGSFDPASCRLDHEPPSAPPRKGCRSEPYTPADLLENPTLAEMTSAALDILGRRDRFWLMVEAGDVDWAAHANDIDAMIGAVASGDDAFRTIVSWVEAGNRWDETAVIVTADHGHMFVLTDPEAFARPAER